MASNYNYRPRKWGLGEAISHTDLNHLEQGVATVAKNLNDTIKEINQFADDLAALRQDVAELRKLFPTKK